MLSKNSLSGKVVSLASTRVIPSEQGPMARLWVIAVASRRGVGAMFQAECGGDTDCGGPRCDKTVTPPVCVASTCTPACDSVLGLRHQTVTCKPVSPVRRRHPVGERLRQEVVGSCCPSAGQVTGVTFQVKNAAGTVIGTGSGTAPRARLISRRTSPSARRDSATARPPSWRR
jgi:hypothetical protein